MGIDAYAEGDAEVNNCNSCMKELNGDAGPLCASCSKKAYDAAEAAKSSVITAEPPMGTVNVNSVEVFSTGEHNGDAYSEADLDQMVRAHREIGSELKPFVKLGHDPKQQLIQNDGWPAAGWVDNVRREGSKLIADFKAVPKQLAEVMKKGGYRRVSSEVFWNLKRGTETFPRVLKAVALLGATTPAVRGLKDIYDLYGGAEPAKAYAITDSDNGADLRIYEAAPEEDRMTVEEQKRLETAEAELKQYKAQEEARKGDEAKAVAAAKAEAEATAAKATADLAATVKLYEEEKVAREAAEKSLKDSQLAAHRAAAESEIDGLLRDGVKAGKVLPKTVAIFKALAMTDLITPDAEGVREYAFKDGEKDAKVSGTARSLVKQLVESMPKQVDFSHRSLNTPVPVPSNGEAPNEKHYAEVGEQAREYQRKHPTNPVTGKPMTLGEATKIVARGNLVRQGR